MGKFIQTVHDRVNFAIKKGITGYYSPSQIDREVHAESMNMWMAHAPKYAKDAESALLLKPFEKIEAITGLTGTATEGSKKVTACHLYPISAALAGNIEVTKLTIAEYNYRFNHPTKFPDAGHPICKFVNDVIYMAPNVDVNVTYLSKPIPPVYAFTATAGDQYAYNDAASTDIEWDERAHDAIMIRVLSNLGINQANQQLIAYSMAEANKELR